MEFLCPGIEASLCWEKVIYKLKLSHLSLVQHFILNPCVEQKIRGHDNQKNDKEHSIFFQARSELYFEEDKCVNRTISGGKNSNQWGVQWDWKS